MKIAALVVIGLTGCQDILGFEDPVRLPDPDPDPEVELIAQGDPRAEITRCIGSLMPTCLQPWPDGVVVVPDLDTDTSPLCAPGSQSTCLIAGRTIIVDGLLSPTGSRPLALVATDSVSLLGWIEFSNHSSAACTSGATATGSGGGAGGSLGNVGGAGGSSSAGTGGQVAPAMAAFQLRFGCPGGQGGSGTTPVAGGRGGGALYVAAPEIYVGGWIDVSGGGGSGGVSGSNGGGGGGSGGMIVLDATTITLGPYANLEANGGGGGEGGGGNAGDSGTWTSGGSGNNANGGDGGAGASLTITDTSPVPDDDAAPAGIGQSSQSATAGSGGGGGGAGLIALIFDVLLN